MRTAIIIDDDPDLGRVLVSFLEAKKIHAMAVHSLAEAEECLYYLKPTVIFLDNSFPDGLGINFIKTIRSADEEIKIIMMTADTADWIEAKAKEEGIHYFLRKPVTRKVLEHALDKINLGNA